ncbi:hypothetical protein BU17DRAFT_55076 [Hysterangium stoloniferum]|nr:hypothetical protein BU17DRAFT_55076 [Hysterangium stoloniferum]
MYQLTQYARLPQEEEWPTASLAPSQWILSSKRILKFLRRPRLIVAFVFVIAIITFVGRNLTWNASSTPSKPLFSNGTFTFHESLRPTYLDIQLQSPLAVRVAVITRRNEFERRHALRQSMLQGIPSTDVQLEYRFFLGERSPPFSFHEWILSWRIAYESVMYGDITLLNDIVDIPARLSEKRYSALKWAGNVPRDTYDYFLTIDSDTFCRMTVLARSLPHLYAQKNLKPREKPILIGRMGSHLTYFQNTVPDGYENSQGQDEVIRGPWFPYPTGIGYMLSSSLVSTLLSATPPLPHHIHYPSDDVMIGAWIAGMRYFPNSSIEFSSIAKLPDLEHSVKPRPYFPQVIETEILDNWNWHDFPGRPHHTKIGWESTCIHRWSGEEMRAFREMSEVKGEWLVKTKRN